MGKVNNAPLSLKIKNSSSIELRSVYVFSVPFLTYLVGGVPVGLGIHGFFDFLGLDLVLPFSHTLTMLGYLLFTLCLHCVVRCGTLYTC